MGYFSKEEGFRNSGYHLSNKASKASAFFGKNYKRLLQRAICGGPTFKRIQFYCDNQGVVEVINSRQSKVPRVMDLVWELTLCTLQHNYFRAAYVSGIKNNIVVSLSRFQMERFHQLAPEANATPDPIPAHLYNL